MKALVAAVLLLVALTGSAQAQVAAPRAGRLDMGQLAYAGANRYIGLYVPRSYQAGHKAPVIFALHGRFSSAQAMSALSHLTTVAEARGAILAFPETIAHRAGPQANVSDDGGFIAATLAAMEHDYSIDHDHLYLVGYDTGGGVAYDLACRGDLHFAGVAIVSALMLNTTHVTCAGATRPVATLIIHGERDLYFSSRGFVPQIRHPGVSVMSADDTIADFRHLNGCGAATATGAGGSQYFAQCSSGAALAYINVPGGEHDWFHAGPHYALNQQGVDAASLIDAFFFDRSAFALPPRPQFVPSRARSYIVYAPPNYNPAQPTPLVIMLHGSPSNAASMAALSQMNAVASAHRFIAVYPDGVDGRWNAFFGIPEVPSNGEDDIAFLKKLTEDLSVDFNIDRRRLYVAGLSNGGFMSIRMACIAGDYFAAFASVAAELYTELGSRCPGPPAPIVLFHGDADPIIPFTGITRGGTSYLDLGNSMPSGGGGMGGMGGGAGSTPHFDRRGAGGGHLTMSAPETATYFMNRNRCDATRPTTDIPARAQTASATHVSRTQPQSCPNNKDVVFFRIAGGGHVWPGVPDILDPSFGDVTTDINAGEEIWSFFAAHTLAHDPN